MKEEVTKQAIKSVTDLGKQGVIGIIILLILGITSISFYAIKMSSNHINHFTEAIQGFEGALRDNTAVLSEINGQLR